MEKFHDNDAFELIKAGLQSGSIKLGGRPNQDDEGVKTSAERDALYLLTLVTKLVGK